MCRYLRSGVKFTDKFKTSQFFAAGNLPMQR